MRTKYVVQKSGYFREDETYADAITKGEFLTEKSAIKLLLTLDEECHYIIRKDYVHIAEGYYDYEMCDEYGYKYPHEFKDTPK